VTPQKPCDNWPQVVIRPATLEDLPYLDHRLRNAKNATQVDLRKAIVFVAEYDGCIVGFTAARLLWNIEPLMLFEEFRRRAPHHARRRATYELAKSIDGWIADRSRNTTGIHGYFCFIADRVVRKLAEHFGMFHIFTGPKFFGRET
jgi:hypothetical protein